MKPYEAIRIEPLNVSWGTGLNVGRNMGATAQGGVVDVSKGVPNHFTVLVGAQVGATASYAGAGETGTAARYVEFSLYEATAATHAGSAVAGATLTLGAATAGTLRGLYDAFYVVASDATTSVNVNINGIDYHLVATQADGSVAAPAWASVFNGQTTDLKMPKIPHYKAHAATGAANFAGTSGVVYIAPDDDEATGLTIQMSAVTDTCVPRMHRLQGKIDVNAHALSTNTPKFLSVGLSTYAGSTGAFYAFLVRDAGGPTPGALVTVNT